MKQYKEENPGCLKLAFIFLLFLAFSVLISCSSQKEMYRYKHFDKWGFKYIPYKDSIPIDTFNKYYKPFFDSMNIYGDTVKQPQYKVTSVSKIKGHNAYKVETDSFKVVRVIRGGFNYRPKTISKQGYKF